MSTPNLTNVAEPSPAATELAQRRAELDRLDDQLHDVLRERAEVVARLANSELKGRVALRPGREAAIVRRLLARHSGPLPPQAIVRIWRELLAATTSMQGAHLVAICPPPSASCAFIQLAREHFGALTPLHLHREPEAALAEVAAGQASAAVLPMPSGEQAWWIALLRAAWRDEPRPYIVAKLPFWTPRPESAPQGHALVASASPPDLSGLDRSLLGMHVPPDMGAPTLIGLLEARGIRATAAILHPEAGESWALVEAEGLLSEADPRLQAPELDGERPPVVLGGYAVPIGEELP